MEEQIIAELNKISINPKYVSVSKEVVERMYSEESEQEIVALELSNRELESRQREMRELIRMSMRGMITEAQFLVEQKDLEKAINDLTIATKNNHDQLAYARRETLNVVDFMATAETEFSLGDSLKKHEIASKLGTAYVFSNRVITIERKPVLIPIFTDIEPPKTGSGSTKKTDLKEAVSLGWGSGTTFEPLHQVWRLYVDDSLRILAIDPA